MKQLTSFIISAVVLIISSCNSESSQDDLLKLAEETIPVKIVPVVKSDLNTVINSSGLLTTDKEARYSFKVGGIIERIDVSEGTFFKKGQLLASLKITEIDAQLSQASLGYEKAKRDYSRTFNLYNDSIATLEQLQNAKTGLEISQKNVDVLTFNKKYAYIYAAADGFVTKKIANDGEVVNGGNPVLAINETSGTSDWVLKLGVTDKEWAAIEVGAGATITLDAFPEKVFSGSVVRKSQSAEDGTGSFQVEVKPIMGNFMPAIGMFGKASITTRYITSLPGVPYEAVLETDGNNAFVFVPIDENHVKKVNVVIESFNSNMVVIKSGLENVSDIIVSNSAFLNEKSTIRIIK